MALVFLKTVTLTGRATRALPEDRSSAHVGNLDCQKRYGGDLNLSPHEGVAQTRSDDGGEAKALQQGNGAEQRRLLPRHSWAAGIVPGTATPMDRGRDGPACMQYCIIMKFG